MEGATESAFPVQARIEQSPLSEKVIHPSLQFFSRCIEKKIVSAVLEPKYSFSQEMVWAGKIDEDKLQEEEALFRKSFLTHDQLLVVNEFDWSRELPRALRKVIRFIWSKKLLGRDDLISTSRFAGPGNVVAVNTTSFGGGGAEFDYRHYYGEKFQFVGWSDVMHGKTFLTPPENRDERNRGIKIKITPSYIAYTAQRIHDAAATVGIPLSPHLACQAAIRETVAHEYLHCVAQGMGNNGIDITKKIAPFLPGKYSFLLDDLEIGQKNMVIQELLCRGFQRMALADFFEHELELSPKKSQELFNRYYQLEKNQSEQVISVIESLMKSGYTYEQLLAMQRSLNDYFKLRTDNRLDPDLRAWFKYSLEPVSPEALQYVLRRYKNPYIDFFKASFIHAKDFLRNQRKMS